MYRMEFTFNDPEYRKIYMHIYDKQRRKNNLSETREYDRVRKSINRYNKKMDEGWWELIDPNIFTDTWLK